MVYVINLHPSVRLLNETCPVFLAVTHAHLVRLYERYQSLDKGNKGHLR